MAMHSSLFTYNNAFCSQYFNYAMRLTLFEAVLSMIYSESKWEEAITGCDHLTRAPQLSLPNEKKEGIEFPRAD